MDFAFTEEQREIAELAKTILRDHCTPTILARLEGEGAAVHRGLWRALADAGLLAVALPERWQGMGGGLTELCLLLEQVGQNVAPIPARETLALGAAPIAEFGSDAQKAEHLVPVAAGIRFLTAALAETCTPIAATARGEHFVLTGELDSVPALPLVHTVLVPAVGVDGSTTFFLVPTEAPGASIVEQRATDGRSIGRLVLADVELEAEAVLGEVGEGEHIRGWLKARALVTAAAVTLGIVHRALRITAKYTTEREQFGRAIGTFQAVTQRAADAYIDVESLRLVLWRTVWLLDHDQPADRDVLVTAHWAAEAGHRVTFAAQHLHGGIGFDRDYPLYRYFLWAKQLEFSMGGASSHLAALGAAIAAE